MHVVKEWVLKRLCLSDISVKMRYRLFSVFCLSIFYLITHVTGQTCPDGFPSVFKCTASKKHKGGYYCKGDEKLGCEFINGVSYCCEFNPTSILTWDEFRR